ncbi:hypothetical protein SEVIR_5G023500v4 [Setaria viridis]|uniref:Uncharacterized protein n=2 Tax=Setaria TaxID=4554 RepID=A0A368R0D7_SETIT|nr:hypothetical protein SETIT_5G024700v2 [Setaria italica]TKW12231.1 hypothetical protein SEVIR_5G023500v2 [Setaria viridis]
MAGGYLTGALLPILLVVQLLAAQALARHTPAAGAGGAPAVEIMYNPPTNDGPSPATGHGNQPSPRTAQDGAPNGETSVTAAAETHAAFSSSPCHCDRGHPPATASGVGKASGVRS